MYVCNVCWCRAYGCYCCCCCCCCCTAAGCCTARVFLRNRGLDLFSSLCPKMARLHTHTYTCTVRTCHIKTRIGLHIYGYYLLLYHSYHNFKSLRCDKRYTAASSRYTSPRKKKGKLKLHLSLSSILAVVFLVPTCVRS